MTLGLASLTSPITGEDFFEAVWQKSPKLFEQALTPDQVQDLLRLAEIDDILSRVAVNASDVDYFAAGDGVTSTDLAAPGNHVLLGRLFGLVADGGTLHISNLQKYHASALRLVRSLRRDFRCKVETDLWITRENSFPAYLHYDSHDIFTIQISGSKRWRVFQPVEVPEARYSPAMNWDEVSSPILDVVLRPGDVFYMPAYTPHAVTTTEAYSVHVGAGVHPLSWRDLLQAVLDESRKTPAALQDSIPTWHGISAEEALDRLADLTRVTLGATDCALVGGCLQGQSSAGDHFYDSALTPFPGLVGDAIDLQTTVARRGGVEGLVTLTDDDFARLTFAGGGLVQASAVAATVFKFAARAPGPFKAADLPDDVPDDTKRALVNRLVEVGYLTVV